MAKMTIADKLVAGLLRLGCTEVKRTTHYRVFEPGGRFKTSATKIYVGRAGAMRGSRSGRVSHTFAYSDDVKARTIDAAFEDI